MYTKILTGTSAGIWPIESVDERPIGRECPGPVGSALGRRFQEITAGRDPEFEHWLTHLDDGLDA